MTEDKPCISELYKSGGLDMLLVSKIAHNELDKRKGSLFNSEHALASEYIDAYIDDHPEVIENYAEELDSKLTVEDYHNGKISAEFVLGVALSHGAASHASCDIEYFNDEFSSRAINEVYEVLAVHDRVQFTCRNADDFSLAGVNPDKKFPIGFVSVKDVADTISELGSDHMKEALKPADMERIASSLGMQNSASSGMSSPTTSRSMRSSRWRKSTSYRVSRVSTISVMRKVKKPNLSRITRSPNAKPPTTNKTSSQGG